MGLLTVLMVVIAGSCFGAGIVFHLGWLVAIGAVILPVMVVLGFYGGSSAGHAASQHSAH